MPKTICSALLLTTSMLISGAAPLPLESGVHPNLVEPLAVARRAIEADAIRAWKPVHAVSSDGRLLVYAAKEQSVQDNSLVINLWMQDLEAKSPPVRLTDTKAQSEDDGTGAPLAPGAAPRFSPDGRTIAFASSENGAIVLIDVASRQQRVLKPRFPTDTKVVSRTLTSVEWGPDGKHLALLFTEATEPAPLNTGVSVSPEWNYGQGLTPRPVPRMALVNIAEGRVIATTRATMSVNEVQWAPDGRQLVISGREVRAPGDDGAKYSMEIDLYLFDVAGGGDRRIIANEGWERAPRWSPDGRRIVFSANPDPQDLPDVLGIYEVASGALRYIGKDWRLEHNDLQWIDAKRVAAVTSEKMGCVIRIVDVDTGVSRPLSPDDLGCNESFAWAPKAKKLVVKRQEYAAPTEFYMTGIDRWQPQRVTQLAGGVNLPVADVRTVSWPSKDGRFTIHGVLITPKDGYEGRRPLIVSIMGGPSMVSATSMGGLHSQHLIHPMLARGYAVLMPNTRGRRGYGDIFYRGIKDYQDYVEGPFNDVMAGVELMDKMGVADTERMAVLGFSYGGILSAYSITRTDRFKAAVLGDPGNIDLVNSGYVTAASFGAHIEWTIMGFKPVYEPGQKEIRARNSALANIDKTRTPALLECGITAGALYSCPMLFQGFQYYKVPSEFVAYPRTGHGITEPALRYDSARRYLEWLDYWVLGTPVPSLVANYGPPKLSEWQRP